MRRSEDRINTIVAVCTALGNGAPDEAATVLRREYPFAPVAIGKRQYGPVESTRVFVRDGFIDRYSGDRVIFPPVLRVIATELPSDFPFHPNWKTDVTHPAFWELGATVDHVVPITRGGADAESNWVTTSMVRNSAKMNWTIEELGWQLHPPGHLRDWDGLLRWFLEYVRARPTVLAISNVKQWYRAAEIVASAV